MIIDELIKGWTCKRILFYPLKSGLMLSQAIHQSLTAIMPDLNEGKGEGRGVAVDGAAHRQ